MTVRRSRSLLWAAAVVLVGLVGAIVVVVAASSLSGSANTTGASSGSAGLGTVIRIPMPRSLRRLPLRNQFGQKVDLASWPGKTVLLVPFLTLCQDVCPMITGNLLQVHQSLGGDHASGSVEIVEITVDPARDTPARLAAYAKLTGASWQLVTEPPAELRQLAKFFGFYYQKVPEDVPGATDWWTGKRLTYDVDHSDDYFVIDPSGVERVVNDAAPDFNGRLNPTLYKFLDELGREHLAHPPQPDWTPVNVLQALTVSVGRPLQLKPLS